MDVVVVEGVRAGREHGREVLAGRALHVAQETLLLRRAAPAVLHGHLAAVGKRERRDIERIAERMLRDARARLAVHPAARIGRDLSDFRDLHAEPLQRRRLHGAREPRVERGDDRTGERRRRLHRHRTGRNRRALAAKRHLLGTARRVGLRRIGLRGSRRAIVRRRLIGNRLVGSGRAILRALRISLRRRAVLRARRIGLRRRLPGLRVLVFEVVVRIGRLAAGRLDRHRSVRRGGSGIGLRRIGLRLRRIRIVVGRTRIVAGRRRGERLAARDRAGRTQLIGKADRCAFADCGDLHGKIRAADAGAGNRLDAGERRAFLHLPRLEAGDLRLMPPRVALREHDLAAGSETEDDEGADEIPGHSARHARRMREIPLRILQGRS